jgi:hypothetical protein
MDYRATERLRAIKKRAIRDNLSYGLDSEWLAERLRVGTCEVSGLKFDLTRRRRPNAYTPSIDRIDASGGYTKENCRVVLLAVNTALQDWGLETFLDIASAIANRRERTKSAA